MVVFRIDLPYGVIEFLLVLLKFDEESGHGSEIEVHWIWSMMVQITQRTAHVGTRSIEHTRNTNE